MRRAVAVLVVLLAACGGPAGEGGGDGGTVASPTGLALGVTYRGSSVVNLSVSGMVTADTRKFGPYMVPVTKVPSGGSIGLVFDPAEAGNAMACVSSIEDDGHVRSSDCASFEIVPSVISHASVQLE